MFKNLKGLKILTDENALKEGNIPSNCKNGQFEIMLLRNNFNVMMNFETYILWEFEFETAILWE